MFAVIVNTITVLLGSTIGLLFKKGIPQKLADAVMLGISSVRIIHGKGTGVLRDELQKLIRTIPGVAGVRDEHIQFGGTGVTIVTFD